jgi:hypothetical protein
VIVFAFYNLNLLTIKISPNNYNNNLGSTPAEIQGNQKLINNNNQDYARIDKSKGEDSVFKVVTTGAKITNKISLSALLVLFCGLVSILGSWLSIAWLVSCPRVVAKSLVLLRLASLR